MIARLLAACVMCASVGVASAAEPPAFVRMPAATRTAEGIRVDFAVNRATDVALSIEDATGRIVRHLTAGVLGPNAPAPLTPNALDQSILWDGKADYGEAAGDGPFQARVALGLGAGFDKVLISDPYTLGGVRGLAVAPDGTLFVMMGCGGTGPVWSGQQMIAFNRDGTYKGTVMPFPADLPMDAVKG
ncbi:MAG: hypothetical protein AMS14_05245, partial [Planctomycetes bacterium DG_20]